MSSKGSCGTRFARNFRTDDPTPPVITGLAQVDFAAARVVHAGNDHGVSSIRPQDAFVFAYLMTEFANSELWVGGRPAKWEPVKPGQVHFYALERGIEADIRDPLDFVYLYLPRSALAKFTDEHELPDIDGCNINTGSALSDPVIANLGRSLLPELRRPDQVNRLLVDQAAFKLQSHFVYHYARSRRRRLFIRGGLTSWQEQRAKTLLHAHINGTISVDQLAKECGLSRSQFFRAFKWTTGKTPHRWLMQSRVEMSKDLLINSRLSLAEIPARCGFANPSHFTRVFHSEVGISPRLWRAHQLS